MRKIKQEREREKAGHDTTSGFAAKLQSFVSRPVRVAAGIKHANLRLNSRQDLLFQFATETQPNVTLQQNYVYMNLISYTQ